MKTLPRAIPWNEEHEAFRDAVKEFMDREVAPQHGRWEKEGMVSRDIWQKAGELGLLCPDFPEEYGGAGGDFYFNVIAIEESARIGNTGFMHSLHGDVVAPYILHHGSEEQKRRWLPDIIAGRKILAIAMTEPDAGSDLAAIRTEAFDNGDHFILNGAKTFISNGYLSDLIVVVARTDPGRGIHGISLFVVERDMPGFERGRRLEKIGLHAQDTAELFFNNVHIPRENLIGKKGHGFRYLMSELQQERLVVAISSMRAAEAMLEETLRYVRSRKAFGREIGRFQNTRFKLAEMATEQAAGRAFLDQVILAHAESRQVTVQASQAKLFCSEMLKRHVDECLQFFGGYGYMMEYPIARAYVDARVKTIYAGTSEIMKEIIASSGLGLPADRE